MAGMSQEQVSVARLKEEVLPALFREPTTLGEYGAGESPADALEEFSNLLEAGAVSALAEKLGEVVAKLADADPQQLVQKSSWFGRLLGREVERQLVYQVARKTLDEVLEEAESLAQRVRDTLKALDDVLASHASEVERLRIYLQAGREFLDENPQAGVAAAGALDFDRPRERFARKLANLTTLLLSHEMSVTQLRLTRTQAVHILDRFSETESVLVPVWRQHSFALITTKTLNPTLVSEASRAHRALMQSLSKSLESIGS